ncbi:MAG: hypothetical protein ACYSTS_16630 [Planctomycetota bacterium]|jgi:hypothetical protein
MDKNKKSRDMGIMEINGHGSGVIDTVNHISYVFDAEGYDSDGYNAAGFNREGYRNLNHPYSRIPLEKRKKLTSEEELARLIRIHKLRKKLAVDAVEIREKEGDLSSIEKDNILEPYHDWYERNLDSWNLECQRKKEG